MKIKDVPVGTEVIAQGNRCIVLGEPSDGSAGNSYILIGFTPDHSPYKLYHWNKIGSRASLTVVDLLTKFGCNQGSWLDKEQEVEIFQATAAVSSVKSGGLFCKRCHEFCPMSQSNQSDGSFLCYSCRDGWIEPRFR